VCLLYLVCMLLIVFVAFLHIIDLQIRVKKNQLDAQLILSILLYNPTHALFTL